MACKNAIAANVWSDPPPAESVAMAIVPIIDKYFARVTIRNNRQVGSYVNSLVYWSFMVTVQLDSVESVDDGANSCIVASFNLDTTTPQHRPWYTRYAINK